VLSLFSLEGKAVGILGSDNDGDLGVSNQAERLSFATCRHFTGTYSSPAAVGVRFHPKHSDPNQRRFYCRASARLVPLVKPVGKFQIISLSEII
jgi:hypothetical protein